MLYYYRYDERNLVRKAILMDKKTMKSVRLRDAISFREIGTRDKEKKNRVNNWDEKLIKFEY